MTTTDKAAEIAAYWGICEGCGARRSACDVYVKTPGSIKCCPDCDHVTALEPRAASALRDYVNQVLNDAKYGGNIAWVRANLHPDHLARLDAPRVVTEEVLASAMKAAYNGDGPPVRITAQGGGAGGRIPGEAGFIEFGRSAAEAGRWVCRHCRGAQETHAGDHEQSALTCRWDPIWEPT